MSNEELKSLLMLLNEISKCGGNSCSDSDKYNIFEVLGVEYKEVIMCRFIGNLLEPKGKHGLGTEPLRLFIRNVLHDEDFGGNLEEAIITLEDSTDNGRRVDIVIYLKDKIYPIEVKIWAGDQNEQLKDYYKFYFGDNKDAKIYYLTPNKHSPSDKSKGEGEDGLKDEQIVRISFTENIKNWLTEVCNIEGATETIKSVIRNFMEVIDKMGNDSKQLNEIKGKMGLDNGEYDNEAIEGAILLLKHRDELWDTIRKNYICNKIVPNNTFKECERILVVSKYALDCQPFYTLDPYFSVTSWLDHDFLNSAFGYSHKTKIINTEIDHLTDKIFLLSIDEVKAYINYGDRCKPTAYAISRGASVYDGNSAGGKNKGNCWWWLRDCNFDRTRAAAVQGDCSIYDYKNGYQTDRELAIRPAMWIDIS